MLRRNPSERSATDESPVDADPDRIDGGPAEPGVEADPGGLLSIRISEPGLAALPIAGITRRRVLAVAGCVLAVWIVIVFARQVSAASAATNQAEDIATANVAARTELGLRERELDAIVRERYVLQQARGFGLGSTREIAFTLAPDAPELADDAPGSAAVRVGAAASHVSPLERWLTVLFGPSE